MRKILMAGLWAGLVAGAVDLVVLAGILIAQGVPLWGPTRMTAAIVLGSGVLSTPDRFAPDIMAAALGVHFALSIVYGVAIALLIHRLERLPALAVGVAFGLAVWLLNYFVIAPAVFPWFTALRLAPTTPFLHALFGIAAVSAYLAMAAAERRTGLERRQNSQPAPEERRHRPLERRGPA